MLYKSVKVGSTRPLVRARPGGKIHFGKILRLGVNEYSFFLTLTEGGHWPTECSYYFPALTPWLPIL